MRRNLIAACLALMTLAGAMPLDDYSSKAWKDEIASGFLPYRKLTMDDFPVDDQVKSPHLMHTEGFFHYQYRSLWTERDGLVTATVSQLTLRSGFDKNKSWKRRGLGENDALLDHEQGHLDINELHANRLRVKRDLPIGSGQTADSAMEDLRVKVKALVEQMAKDAQTEQDQYDAETNHGKDKEKQKQWSAGFRRRLDDQRISFWDGSG
jgi:hypothetical protein